MQKKKFLYLIIGRSGVGKDYLAKLLVNMGLNMVISYATRPRRYEGEATHIFITPEEAKNFPDRVAETEINGYEYFATRKQVNDADIYIIDPVGAEKLISNMPEAEFGVIYVVAHENSAREAAVNRGINHALQREIFVKRRASEDAQFTKFENDWDKNSGIFKNENVVYKRIINNDYSEKKMRKEAEELMCLLLRRTN